MGEPKFYRRDPLAALLLDRLNLKPISGAIFVTLVEVGIAMLMAWTAGSLVTHPGQIGIFWDPYFWVWNIFLVAPIWAAYLWTSNAMSGLLHGLSRSPAVRVKKGDMRVALEAFGRPWRNLLAFLVAVATCLPYYFSRFDVQGWEAAAPITRLWSAAWWVICMYAVGMLILNLATNAWVLNRIMSNRGVRIIPLHYDQCGGLKVLSDYTLTTVYCVLPFAVVVGLSQYRFITQGMVQEHWVVLFEVPALIVLATVLFFTPLIAAHKAMRESRDELLGRVTDRFSPEYFSMVTGKDRGDRPLEEGVTRLEQLASLYDITMSFPVWPFNTSTIRKFVASVAALLLPFALAIVADIAARLILPT